MNNLFRSQILNNYTINVFPKTIIVKCNMKEFSLQTSLIYDKQQEKIYEQNIQDAQYQEQISEEYQMSAIFGIYEGQLQKYLVTCKKCELVAQVQQQKYYKVQSVQFIGLKFLLDKKQHPQELELIETLRNYLQNNFYFSFFGNPTLPLQSQLQNITNLDEFTWNSHLLYAFQEEQIQPSWYCKLIQGYVHQIQSKLGQEQIKYVIISRKSKHQSGTRYFHRGINDDGQVANFVSTECIIFIKELCLSHVILRGSVPTFWKQTKGRKIVKLTRNQDLCQHAFLKHFTDLQQQYKYIYCVNLMGEKPDEQLLNDTFKQMVESNHIDGVLLTRIDFHKICRNEKPKEIDVYIRKLDDESNGFNCFTLNVNNQTMLTKQVGIFRINCLDCLDRTNAFQCRLSLRIADIILKKHNINNDLDLLQIIDDPKWSDFINQYRIAWAENGDAVSQLYCGTNATTSEFTKQGKTTLKGMFTHRWASIERFFNQALVDSAKNQQREAFLYGVKIKKSQMDMFLQSQMKSYCKFQKYKLYAVTWNVNSKDIKNLNQDIFKFDNEFSPDLIVIGLQEITQLNAVSVINNNQDKVNQWIQVIDQSLNGIEAQYSLIQYDNLVGILVLVYIKKGLINTISKIQTDRIKTGYEGAAGNKGACLIRFNIFDTDITFCNCHLAAGNNKNKRRIESLKEIHEKAFKSTQKSIDQSDYTILLGDMNFRLKQTQKEARESIEEHKDNTIKGDLRKAEQCIIKLQQHDQGYDAKSQYPLQEYQEAGIVFLPTYKFENSHTYNYSKEKYIPSYCDRIFIRSNEQAVIKQLKYDSIDRFDSDHQPVVALFFIDVKQVDKQKESKLIQEFNKKNKELQQEEIQLYRSSSNLTVEEPQQQVQEQQQEPVIVQKKSLTQKLKDKLFK